jgi:AmmeMemoRadiSam system protein B/AmmeMemoRadiSam system protein A
LNLDFLLKFNYHSIEDISMTNKLLIQPILIILLFISIACGQDKKPDAPEVVRYAAVAGTFYPNDPILLTSTINKFLKDAQIPNIDGEIIGIVSPHAGYVFSAPVAAYAYKALIGKKYDVVVIIAPSHQEFFKGCSVFNGDAYETPLGKLKVDKETAKQIAAKSENVYLSKIGHEIAAVKMGEHSLEVQLPFLQMVLKEFSIVPIVMGEQSEKNCDDLGTILADVLKNKKALIVASSDLSHYHPYDAARRIDAETVTVFEKGDSKSILNCEACGAGPITAMLIATKNLGSNQTKILKYATSGDVPEGERGRVVGYMSGISVKPNGKSNSTKVGFDLSLDEKKELIALAKETINKCVNGEKISDYSPKNEILKRICGAFVTIHKKGDLRGCIGHIIATEPLYKTVQSMAVAAALEDPRFVPVSKEELPLLDIEISVLSPFERVTDIDEIKVGVHGLLISKGGYRGLLLPQVATEYNWDRDTFLQQTCRKAGLPGDAYKDPSAVIEKFSAIVFGEKDIK